MHTQQLLCFVCVADKLNFTKAAEELFLSTPTVTHHIKTLENELGTTLFIRNSKMVRLTESGVQFYQDAQEILARMEIAEKRIRRIARIYDLTDAKAKERIVKTDKQRASYYNYYSNKKWSDADSYNICLDSSVLGIDGTAEAIERLVEIKEQPGEKRL